MNSKLGKQIFNNTFLFTIYIFLLEMIVKININPSTIFDWSTIRIIISSSFFGLILGFIMSLWKNKIFKKIYSSIIFILLAIYTWVEINLCNYIGFFMGVGNTEQGTKIVNYIADFIKASPIISYLVFVLLCLFLIYYLAVRDYLIYLKLQKTTYFVFKKDSKLNKLRSYLFSVLILILLSIAYVFSLKASFMQNKVQSIKNSELILVTDYSNLSVSQFGLFVYGLSDIVVTTFDISIIVDDVYVDNREDAYITDNSREFDDTAWQYVIDNEDDNNDLKLHNYFINRTITEKNDHTGLFEGKNLIVILMESVNMIAINEKEYPTLYKLYNEGISFRNNYSPRNNCSTGNNEMAAMTSLYTINNTCTANKYKNNIYPQAIFNLFNNAGYNTSSYHNYAEFYYYRRTIHPNMGSSKYYNVTDLNIAWSSKYEEWPSDVDLMKQAVPNFINEDKFMAFIITVSSHQPYGTSSELGDKYLSELSEYDYSKAVKRYMSKLKELDLGLKTLLEKLEETGKLDDTVIALFSDHYPYGLSNKELTPALNYDVKVNNETDRTPMIIYNSTIKSEIVEKYTTIIDLLPTLLNMFNLNYDPRLYLGNDIFSEYDDKAIFADGSWQDAKGFFSVTKGKFIPVNEEDTYTEDELYNINSEIIGKQKMSALAINNYFESLFNKINEYNEFNKVDEETIESEE